MMHKQDDNAQVLARLAALKAMSVKELKAEWDKLFETEAPNNSRSFLEQRLAYRIQELTLGCPSKPVRQLLDDLAIGRAHVCTPVNNAQIVCRLLIEQTTNT